MESNGLLTATVFLPLAGAVVIALGVRGVRAVRWAAAITSLATLVLSVVVFSAYYMGREPITELARDWVPVSSFRLQYLLVVDGLSAPLVLLTGLLGAAAVYSSWSVRDRVREYFVWLLTLQTAVMGVFMAQDLLLFFLFWELELVPMFFLISIWGSGRREYSAMKFLIFTILGSAFMLVGILALFFSTGTFDVRELPEAVRGGGLVLPAAVIFGFLFAAFAVKLPVLPAHTWLPDAHTDAPTAGSIMLAGVLLKMGGYGIIRLCVGIFPEVAVSAAWALATLGVLNVLYGAVVVIRQTDMKRLVAYSSISHMGYVLVGIASVSGAGGQVSSLGLTGASLQMFSHGVITGLLFLLVGLVYEKAHTRYIPDFGGVASRQPLLAVSFLVAGLAALGLPSTSGFAAELTVFLGTFGAWRWHTALAAFGVVLAAGYILWMVQRVFFGPAVERFQDLRDATKLEMVPVVALLVAIMVVGLYPRVLTDVFAVGLGPIVEGVRSAALVRAGLP